MKKYRDVSLNTDIDLDEEIGLGMDDEIELSGEMPEDVDSAAEENTDTEEDLVLAGDQTVEE